jgi:hypothetical protein
LNKQDSFGHIAHERLHPCKLTNIFYQGYAEKKYMLCQSYTNLLKQSSQTISSKHHGIGQLSS